MKYWGDYLINLDYIPGNGSLLECPSHRWVNVKPGAPNHWGRTYASYGYNAGYVGSRVYTGGGGWDNDPQKITKLRNVGYMLMDNRRTLTDYDGWSRTYPMRVYSDNFPAPRHDGNINILYTDGHVSAMVIDSSLDPYGTLGTDDDGSSPNRWTCGQKSSRF